MAIYSKNELAFIQGCILSISFEQKSVENFIEKQYLFR